MSLDLAIVEDPRAQTLVLHLENCPAVNEASDAGWMLVRMYDCAEVPANLDVPHKRHSCMGAGA